MDLPFHHNAHQKIFENARFLKKVQTEAEELVWSYVRNRKLDGFKFRRQHPVDRYILDFYCDECKLGVELDGKIHEHYDNPEYDKNRTQDLNALGIKIIRFTNDQVLKDISLVLTEIKKHLLPLPSPLRRRAGDEV